MTVRDVLMALIDLREYHDLPPTNEAVVQFTFDDEHFYAIDEIVDHGPDGIVATLVPFPEERRAS